MTNKSPQRPAGKKPGKTLKEKRADKKAKVASRAGNDVTDVTHRK